MDSEEQRIRQRIEKRQQALSEKVALIKARVERIKQMSDVKAMATQRPALMIAGSVLAGFLVGKIALGKNNRHARDAAYDSRYYPPPPARGGGLFGRFGNQVLAVVTGVATRTAINYFTDLGKDMLPRKSDLRRAERDFRGHP
jgi:hypothetical protein